MKLNLKNIQKASLITLLLIFASCENKNSIIEITDEKFKTALLTKSCKDISGTTLENIDINNDGEIQISEAENIRNLNISGLEIRSLKGL